MSFFEIIMLVCFGASWPLSVYKTWKTKSTDGKSFRFLVLIFIGYLSGIAYKITGRLDGVIALYILNLLFVSLDMVLHIKYRWCREGAVSSVDTKP